MVKYKYQTLKIGDGNLGAETSFCLASQEEEGGGKGGALGTASHLCAALSRLSEGTGRPRLVWCTLSQPTRCVLPPKAAQSDLPHTSFLRMLRTSFPNQSSSCLTSGHGSACLSHPSSQTLPVGPYLCSQGSCIHQSALLVR